MFPTICDYLKVINSLKMGTVKCVVLLLLCSHYFTETHAINSIWLYRHDQFSFILRWRESNRTIYDGNSVDKLLAMCPTGCGPGCTDFPVQAPNSPNGSSVPSTTIPCTKNDIEVLRKAQKLAKEWKDLIQDAPKQIIIHSTMMAIILLLIIILIIRGHYRFRDLWFLPSNRQWELEKDPTWGLPGKVWGLLQMRVVKSDDPDSKPTDRKYASYTDNPTTLGDKFWYYKQALLDMYKTHKYYKRNRYFHKLAWQFTKLGKLVPETLRRQKSSRRRAGELEELRSTPSSEEVDVNPQENLPWEIDLADEVNTEVLRKAKQRLLEEVEKQKKAGRIINGRYNLVQHHHHHHHHPHLIAPLTKDEVETTARNMVVDPNADGYNVDGVMRRHPTMLNQVDFHHSRHHHHHHTQQQQPQVPQQKGATGTGQKFPATSRQKRQ